MDDMDKDIPGGDGTNNDPFLSSKVNLDGGDRGSFGTPSPGDPGGDVTMDNRGMDNPDSGSTSDDPFLSSKVNLDGSDKNSFGTPPPGDPGGDVTMDNKDKDNPGGGSTDADPSLSNKVNLDGSSANDNPGSRDFNTLHQLASSNTKASRFSLIISVTKAPLNEPTGEVMNTTLDKVSFGTPLMDDPGPPP